MNSHLSHWQKTLCTLLAFALLAAAAAPAALAQKRKRKPVVVSFGQPNIWSLEQAHYLLARMHTQNLDLRARELADDALDPNAVNAIRINILKQLLEVGVSFDDAVRFQNQLLTNNASFNNARRLELKDYRDRQQAESLRLARELAVLENERAAMDTDKTASKEAMRSKEAEVAQKKAEQAAVQKQIDFDNAELTTLGAQPSGTPQTPAVSFPDRSKLPTGLLDKLVEKSADKLLDLAKDPKLNASTILDNHIQMQYEIIAKQLTLLRDEVGPGERLVFLELPQSLYTTPGSGDGKMAQAWWHVDGYTKTDPLLRLLLELYEVEQRWHKIKEVPGFTELSKIKIAPGSACDMYEAVLKTRDEAENDRSTRQAAADKKKGENRKALEKVIADIQKKGETATPEELKKLKEAQAKLEGELRNEHVIAPSLPPTMSVEQTGPDGQVVPPVGVVATQGKETALLKTFYEFRCEYETARSRLIDDLFREARSDFARAQQGGARDTSEMVDAIRELLRVKSTPISERARQREADEQGKPVEDVRRGVTQIGNVLTEDETEKLRLKLYTILSDPDNTFTEAAAHTHDYDFAKGIQFVPTRDADPTREGGSRLKQIGRRTVRTVDIIPRQSSLNVNDVRDTVKAVGIWGAFKFLFGLGAQTSFQRQREQFEQFLHQELYASGFGKGDRDFGWTFGALPGTNRVAPGVRTTYAVLVVPEDAESLVVSARGCYFPRKSVEPLDYEDTAHLDWDRESRYGSYNCGEGETYIIPIPGGGDANNFWVTNVDYQPADKGGRVTVSIRGNNFSSQIGVLVNGVPLNPAVGLAQPLLTVARKNATAAPPCDKQVCGEYERIDPRQVVASFSLPKNAKGEDVEGIPTLTLVAPGKSVDLNRLDITVNGRRHTQLTSKDTLLMFGARPTEKLTIADFKVFPISTSAGSSYGRGRGRADIEAFALLTGTKFMCTDQVFVNGRQVGESSVDPNTGECKTGPGKELKGDKVYRLIFKLPQDDEVSVTIVPKEGVPVTKSFANPLAMKIDKVTVLSYDPPDRRTRGVLLIKVEGAGFDAKPVLSVEGASKTDSKVLDSSSTEALVLLVDPKSSVVVTLTNTTTGQQVSTVVARTAAGATGSENKD